MIPKNNEQTPKVPSTDTVATKDAQGGDAQLPADNKGDMQGEGNYDAAREFNAAERKFVASGKVAEAARAAAPKSEAEQQEMIAAEEAGRQRAKE